MPKSTDANQSEIVKELRKVGATVADTHELGHGFPDLTIGCAGVTIVSRTVSVEVIRALLSSIDALKDCVLYDGANILIEAKDGSKPPSKRKLTPDELKWHELWRGQVDIANNVEEALRIIGAILKECPNCGAIFTGDGWHHPQEEVEDLFHSTGRDALFSDNEPCACSEKCWREFMEYSYAEDQ